jgi:tRNA nucleotidyltransferase (CCA-adding enzyme)
MLHHSKIHCTAALRPETVWKLFRECDAVRRPERFLQMLEATLADARGRKGLEAAPYPQAAWMATLLAAARQLDAGALAATCADTRQLAQNIERERIRLIAECRQALGLAEQAQG